MGAIMFDNEIFSRWLEQKSQEIINKVDKERITTEEMMVLTLKAQSNHFDHLDQEFRGELKSIRSEMAEFKAETREELHSIRSELAEFKVETREEFKAVREEIKDVRSEIKDVKADVKDVRDQSDKRFDRLGNFMMWQTGIIATLLLAIGAKLYST